MSAEPLVWVVTPVYNGERYVEECVESVIAQTYGRWEYVVADNCSTDQTREIVRSYAARDARIRLVTADEFLPVIANWNRALSLLPAEASYCKVVHADDTLFPECLERMVAISERNPSVGVVSSYALWGDDVRHEGVPYPQEVVSGREICRAALLGESYVFGSPTSVMVRAELVRERPKFYDESNLHADTEVCFALLRERDLGFAHQILTRTRVHEDAMTSFAARVNTFHAGWLAIQTTYGDAYLSRAEDLRVLVGRLWGYFYFMAKAVVKRRFRDPGFRAHHRDSLKIARRAAARAIRLALGRVDSGRLLGYRGSRT